jgi:opacity protein-like surface antigen
MRKIILLAALVASASTIAAPSNHTITGGYARTSASDAHLNGFNVKYGYQFDSSPWGIIGSLTGTGKSERTTDDEGYKADVDAAYASVMVGPSYNITDDAKIYALVGSSGADIQVDYGYGGKDEYKAHSPVFGVGFQYAVWEGLTVDVSYEYSKFKRAEDNGYYVDSFSAKTFTIGVGYKF